MSSTPSTQITEALVYEAIADVLDPELDESLVKLGFIDRIQVEGPDVTVTFKLPTYWCSPNFAYLMASDLRSKVQATPGVRSTRILLVEHCAEDEVTNGVNQGHSFAQAFPEEQMEDEHLEDLRRTFLRKGFLMRQETLLRQLQKANIAEEHILSLRIADLTIDDTNNSANMTTPTKVVPLPCDARTARAYLNRMAALTIPHQPHDLLFVNDTGQSIPPGSLQRYIRQSRSVRMNIMFNTVFCVDMFHTRYGKDAHHIVLEGDEE